MNQQIRHTEHRILLVFSDHHIHNGAVFLCHNTMDRQRKRYPLIFLDSAVIMSIQIRESGILVKRILFYIHTRRIDMRAEDIHSVGQRLASDLEQHDRFLHAYCINLIPCVQRCILLNAGLKISVACLLRLAHDLCHALTLGFSIIQEFPVSVTQFVHFLQFFLFVVIPCCLSLHCTFLLYFYFCCQKLHMAALFSGCSLCRWLLRSTCEKTKTEL